MQPIMCRYKEDQKDIRLSKEGQYDLDFLIRMTIRNFQTTGVPVVVSIHGYNKPWAQQTTICGDNRSTVYTDIKAIFMIVKPVFL